jgi:hypothetical protein
LVLQERTVKALRNGVEVLLDLSLGHIVVLPKYHIFESKE